MGARSNYSPPYLDFFFARRFRRFTQRWTGHAAIQNSQSMDFCLVYTEKIVPYPVVLQEERPRVAKQQNATASKTNTCSAIGHRSHWAWPISRAKSVDAVHDVGLSTQQFKVPDI